MTRLLPILLLLLTGCANLSGTRDYVPAPGPVNPDDFTPLPRSARVAPLMLSQPTMRTPHAVASDLPPEPSAAPMVLKTNAAAPKPADRVIAFHYPTNAFTFWDVQACSDPSFDPRKGGLTVVLRNCYGAPSGDLVVTNRGQGRMFYRIVGHNDYH